MIFQYLVLEILKRIQKERSISSPFHLLRGKRSGQTVQDVGIFRLHSFFGILPKLQRRFYDETIDRFVEQHFIILIDDTYQLTEKGNRLLEQYAPLPFDGWHYQGNEHVFFSRLSLIVQSLSHSKAGKMSFSPIQKDEQIQLWVRSFLIKNQYAKGHLQHILYDEIVESLAQTPVQERAKDIVSKRLAGFGVPGFTWQQISIEQDLTEMDVQLIYISCLHAWLNVISDNPAVYPYLFQMMDNIRIEVPLSGSAYQTAALFKKGYSIEQISHMRRLKQNTIEDHIVELAMNDPTFSIEQFVQKDDIKRIYRATENYQTKKLKILKEALPHLSYFQIRLVLTRGEEQWN